MRHWPAPALWLCALAVVAALPEPVDLGSRALPLVLASALSGWWASPAQAWCLPLAGTLVFNWLWVPPVGTLKVDQPTHWLLLLTLCGVSMAVAGLMLRQRGVAQRAARQSAELQSVLELHEGLRSATDTPAVQVQLQGALRAWGFDSVVVADGADPSTWAGECSSDEREGLLLCQEQRRAFGPGSGRYEAQPHRYVPLWGASATDDRPAIGAVLLRAAPGATPGTPLGHIQALLQPCAWVLERNQALVRAQEQARTAAQHELRHTLLAALSHDYRTPLAAIGSAASALQAKGAELAEPRRLRLAQSISEEVDHLNRITDNALQLVRLGDGVHPELQWESVEELLGSVLARVRRRDPGRRIRLRVAPDLPLLRCHAVWVVQLLENLLDNALQHAPAPAPIEVRVGLDGPWMLLAVSDRGPGVPWEWRHRIFEPFRRVPTDERDRPTDAARSRGVGLGLAVCRAIARAHEGRLDLRLRSRGGSSFELRLPLACEAPSQVPEAGATP